MHRPPIIAGNVKPKLMTRHATAKIFGDIHLRTVDRLVKAGKLRGVKVGSPRFRRRRFRRPDDHRRGRIALSSKPLHKSGGLQQARSRQRRSYVGHAIRTSSRLAD